MPSLGIHLLVADHAFSELGKAPKQTTRSLDPIVRHFPEMASLGAIGPDLFYYLGEGPIITAAVADVLHFLHQISSVIGEVGSLAQQAGMPNIGNRINQIGDTVNLAVGTAQSGLLAAVVVLNEVITGSRLFNPSEQQEEKPESDWNWGDILHDRISGVFANKLLNTAIQSKNYPLMAYSCGYMTHLATDFVGHPYVNTVVGGPARGWNMRHTLAEKFMDASVFHRRGRDINTSRLHYRFSSLADTNQLPLLSKTGQTCSVGC
jgi:Zinc dependent phospholipase C